MFRTTEIIKKISMMLIGVVLPTFLIITSCNPLIEDHHSIADPNSGEFGVLDLTDSILNIVDSQFVEILNRNQKNLFYLDSLKTTIHIDEDKIHNLNKNLIRKIEVTTHMEEDLDSINKNLKKALARCKKKEEDLSKLKKNSIEDSIRYNGEINHLHTMYSKKVRRLQEEIDTNNVRLNELHGVISNLLTKKRKRKI